MGSLAPYHFILFIPHLFLLHYHSLHIQCLTHHYLPIAVILVSVGLHLLKTSNSYIGKLIITMFLPYPWIKVLCFNMTNPSKPVRDSLNLLAFLVYHHPSSFYLWRKFMIFKEPGYDEFLAQKIAKGRAELESGKGIP